MFDGPAATPSGCCESLPSVTTSGTVAASACDAPTDFPPVTTVHNVHESKVFTEILSHSNENEEQKVTGQQYQPRLDAVLY